MVLITFSFSDNWASLRSTTKKEQKQSSWWSFARAECTLVVFTRWQKGTWGTDEQVHLHMKLCCICIYIFVNVFAHQLTGVYVLVKICYFFLPLVGCCLLLLYLPRFATLYQLYCKVMVCLKVLSRWRFWFLREQWMSKTIIFSCYI